MKIKKYMPLIVSGAIALLLLVVEVLLLLRFHGQYTEVRGDLKKAESDVEALMRRDPFPSGGNARIEKENLAKLDKQVDRLQDWMRENQMDLRERSTPTEFQIKLKPDLQDLWTMAAERDIALPQNYHFSFAKYAQGDLPEAEDVARLSRQLSMIKTICRILFDRRIESFDSVERIEFDAGGRAGRAAAGALAGRGRGRGGRSEPQPAGSDADDKSSEQRDDQGLFAWEEISVEFSTKEQALWSVLRTLANTNLLVSVEDLSFNSGNESLETVERPEYAIVPRGTHQPAGFGISEMGERGRARSIVPDGGRDGGEEKIIPPREERVIAGDSTLNVLMRLKVYRFLDDDGREESRQ